MSIEPLNPVVTLSGATMGTRFAVQIAKDAISDTTRLCQALQSAVDAVDQQMSPWIASSNLNQLNAAPVGVGLPIPAQFLLVLMEAIAIEAKSGGAFSPTVGPSVKYWGFSATKAFDGVEPGVPETAQAALLVDADSSVVVKRKQVEIDLCGIAKGYGVDELARVLHEFGVHDFVASIDGEVSAAGVHPSGAGWHIALEYPDTEKRSVHRVLECQDLSLATSGGYRHFRQSQSRDITHTINPSSGQPCSDFKTSVTVAADRCVLADAWATALLVLGAQDGIELAKQQSLNALFLGPDQISASGAFSQFS